MTRCATILGAAMLAGLTPTGANAQYPGYAGPMVGGFGGYPGGYGGTGGFGTATGMPIYPFGTPGGFGSINNSPYAPNFYNRANQPLSPYLNLLRGGNTAVNYFYGVRPGLPSGQPIGMGFGTGYSGVSQARAGFVPQIAGNPTDEPIEVPPVGDRVIIPPSAHPVVFGNKFGPNTGGQSGGFGRGRPAGFGGGAGQQQGSGGGAAPRIPQSR